MMPKKIGAYKLLNKLGEGGLGIVFKVQHEQTKKFYALKKIHEIYQRHPKILGLFHKEMMIHGQIFHKNCVKFIEANLKPPLTHIITSYIDGFTFFQLLTDKRFQPPPLISCCLFLELLRGLEHLHCLDIIHSDLSPANIMLAKNGRVKLADFGLSAIQEVEDYAGIRLGTPGYMPPERLLNKPVSIQTDLFSITLMLGEFLSKRRLVQSSDPYEQYKILSDLSFKWLNFSDKTFQTQIIKVLKKGCSLSPDKRYQSARELMFDIYSCVKQFEIRYLRRAILQWLNDKQIASETLQGPLQKIYF
jgi:serine/threonine-protein kinase